MTLLVEQKGFCEHSWCALMAALPWAAHSPLHPCHAAATLLLFAPLPCTGYDVFRRCRVTIPCHNTRRAIQKAVSWAGQVGRSN